MADEFRTVAAEHRYSPPDVKGSRFLATAVPVSTHAEAEEALARLRREFKDASHNCFAYRVGIDGAEFRLSDDGEPSSSAGRPILQQIDGHGLTNTLVVVTRYFGGTKLGVGGLMRAYGGAAGQALDRADIRTVLVLRRLVLEHPYDCSGTVQGLLVAYELTPAASDYGESVRLELDVPERLVDDFTREFRDRTAGRGTVHDAE